MFSQRQDSPRSSGVKVVNGPQGHGAKISSTVKHIPGYNTGNVILLPTEGARLTKSDHITVVSPMVQEESL